MSTTNAPDGNTQPPALDVVLKPVHADLESSIRNASIRLMFDRVGSCCSVHANRETPAQTAQIGIDRHQLDVPGPAFGSDGVGGRPAQPADARPGRVAVERDDGGRRYRRGDCGTTTSASQRPAAEVNWPGRMMPSPTTSAAN